MPVFSDICEIVGRNFKQSVRGNFERLVGHFFFQTTKILRVFQGGHVLSEFWKIIRLDLTLPDILK